MPSFKLALLILTFEVALLLQHPRYLVDAIGQTSNSSKENYRRKLKGKKGKKSDSYEVWASDQSNSVPDETSAGVNGSYLWVWDSESIGTQLDGDEDATPLPCTPNATAGPCDLWDVFPRSLEEMDADGPTGNVLGDLPKFGRLHGMIKDPQNRYITTNMYVYRLYHHDIL